MKRRILIVGSLLLVAVGTLFTARVVFRDGADHVLTYYLGGRLPEATTDLEIFEIGGREFTRLYSFKLQRQDFDAFISRTVLQKLDFADDTAAADAWTQRWSETLKRPGITDPDILSRPWVVYRAEYSTDATYCTLITDTNLSRVYVYCRRN